MKRTLIFTVLCWTFSSAASAQCLFSFKRGAAVRPVTTMSARTVTPDEGPSAAPQANAPDTASIAGLWHVKFVADGQVVDEGFDQYHSDGTEILNDTPPPSAGNVCLGVWARTSARALKLKHPSWIYDPTNTFPIGTATINELVTLDRGGDTFTGTFTVVLRDLDGNSLGPDLTGQIQADRITVD